MIIMRSWVKFMLFLSAYTPLFLIFIIKYLDFLSIYFFIWISIIAVANIFWIPVFYITKNWTANYLKVKTSSNKTGDVLTYIIAYIITFVRFEFSCWQDWVSLFILLIILFIVFINSNLIFINPILNIAGYKIHLVTTSNEETLTLISKKIRLSKNKQIKCKNMSDDIFLEVE